MRSCWPGPALVAGPYEQAGQPPLMPAQNACDLAASLCNIDHRRAQHPNDGVMVRRFDRAGVLEGAQQLSQFVRSRER